MPDPTQLALYFAVAFLLAVTPGPGIFYVAARTLAGHVTPERFATGALYPPIADLRSISRDITLAVAREAMRSGVAAPNDALEADVDAAMWWPDYVPYVPA